MAKTVADGLWEMLVSAGVRRCYGIVGDALNPVIDALRPGDVREGLPAALAHSGGPVVVDVVVDRYALARPVHVPAASARGFTLSLARQALHGQMDDVIATAEHNVRLL